ncbi:hypothetical protein J6590_107478, partial [Homalodisca vitripennis]
LPVAGSMLAGLDRHALCRTAPALCVRSSTNYMFSSIPAGMPITGIPPMDGRTRRHGSVTWPLALHRQRDKAASTTHILPPTTTSRRSWRPAMTPPKTEPKRYFSGATDATW